MKLTIKRGDITTEQVDVIVNAANKYMLGGGGVDGAIHKAAGHQLREECINIDGEIDYPEMGTKIRCREGEIQITGAYNLPAKHIIHTVGPKCPNGKAGEHEQSILRCCWDRCLRQANLMGLKTIAFPSIATGGYLFPIEIASQIAIESIQRHVDEGTDLEEVRIVCFSEKDVKFYKDAVSKNK
mgnify:CR=1 FL=1